jgi:cyclase
MMKMSGPKRGINRSKIANVIGGFLFLAAATIAAGSSYVTTERSVTKIADGVYVIIHKEIRRITTKPVRYLVNTHFHLDHNAGDSVYMEAFPGLEIVAQTETRKLMDARNPTGAADIASSTGRPSTVILPSWKKELETGKDDEGKPLSAEYMARLPIRIAQEEKEIEDYKTFKYQPPTLTFDHELALDLGNREVQLKHWGRGHTPGDVFVYLPQDKILITGDLLAYPLPYMRMTFPHEWVEVLRRMSRLEANYIVPGHGIILQDKTHMNDVIALLDSVIRQVHEQAPHVSRLEDLHVDIESLRRKMTGGNPVDESFWNRIVNPGMIDGIAQGVVGRAYAEETGKL